MTGRWALKSLEVVQGDWLADSLAEHGLEVVRGHWLKGAPYPVLFVRPKQGPPAPIAESGGVAWLEPEPAPALSQTTQDFNSRLEASRRAMYGTKVIEGKAIEPEPAPSRAVLVPEHEPDLSALAAELELCAACGHRRILHTEDANPLTGEPLGCFAWECTCRKFEPAAGGAQ